MELVETNIDNERQHQYEANHHEAIYYNSLKISLMIIITKYQRAFQIL